MKIIRWILLCLLLNGTACAPAAPTPAPMGAPTSTPLAIPSPTLPPLKPSPTPARPSPTPTTPPSQVPAALERRDLSVISPGNAARMELLAAFRPGPLWSVSRMLFTPDRTRLIFALTSTNPDENKNAQVYIWDLAAALPGQILDSGEREDSGLSLSTDGTILASAGPLRLWDTTLWQVLPALPGAQLSASILDFNPRGSWMALGFNDGRLSAWDLEQSTEKWAVQVQAHKAEITALAVSPDGAQIASAGLDGKLRVWKAPSGEKVHDLPAGAGVVNALAFTPDGQELLTYDKSGLLRTWRLSDSKEIAGFQACSSGLPGCNLPVFSPDRRLIALNDPALQNEAGVHLWDLKAGAPILHLKPSPTLDPARIHSLAFSPDGRLLAVGSTDGQVELWGIPGTLFATGASLRVIEPGDGLNLRDRPALEGSIRSQMHSGDTLTLLEGPLLAGGFNWWRVKTADGREGWIVEIPEWFG